MTSVIVNSSFAQRRKHVGSPDTVPSAGNRGVTPTSVLGKGTQDKTRLRESPLSSSMLRCPHTTPARVTLPMDHGVLKRRLCLGSRNQTQKPPAAAVCWGHPVAPDEVFQVSEKSQDLWADGVLGGEEACGKVRACGGE